MIILTFWCSWCFGQSLEETEGRAQEETIVLYIRLHQVFEKGTCTC